jgi:hypothetical protein
MHRKNFSLLACGVIAALAVSGCGKDEYARVPGATPAPVAAAATAAAPAGATARADVAADAQFASAAVTDAQLSAMKEIATCSLENVVDLGTGAQSPGPAPNSYLVGKGKHYKLIGFATNQSSGQVPATIRLLLAGASSYAIATPTGGARPDVASYFKVPAFANAGFQADAAFDDVAPGQYRVFVLEGEGEASLACPTHQTLELK